MELNGVLHNGESETGAAHTTRASFVNTIESLEQTRKLHLINAASVILKSYSTTFFIVVNQTDIDILATRIGDGVFREVTEYRSYQLQIAFYHDDFIEISMQVKAFVLWHHFQFISNLVDDAIYRDAFFSNQLTTALHSGDERHVFQEAT